MPELEPLNVVEASASMPIPLATQNEQKQAARQPSDIWDEKVKELKEQHKQDLLYFMKHWNPLNLKKVDEAQGEDMEKENPADCSPYIRKSIMYDFYTAGWHLSRDASKLLCLLAIVGIPWNHVTSDDQIFFTYFYIYLVLFTLMASRSTLPNTGSTFLRTVLLIEKSRESIATKRKAFFAHTVFLLIYIFYYVCTYLQSSCYAKHYGPNQNQWNLTQIKMDRDTEGNGTEPCRYWSPFPIEPVTLNRSSYRESGKEVPFTFWWPALPADALLPNSIAFYVVVFAYFTKMIFDVFLYNDVYNHVMLPSPEFVRTHYPEMFAKAKEIVTRMR